MQSQKLLNIGKHTDESTALYPSKVEVQEQPMLTGSDATIRQKTNVGSAQNKIGLVDLVGLSLQLLLRLAVGPVVPEDTANRVWQHNLDFGVHVLQEAPSATDGAASAASSHKVGHPCLGLHPDLHKRIQGLRMMAWRQHEPSELLKPWYGKRSKSAIRYCPYLPACQCQINA